MCIIIACISCSVGSFAASGKVYTIDELEKYGIDSVITNESETIAVLTTRYCSILAFTKNGKDYSIINFDKYLPAGSDYIQIYEVVNKGDLFVLFLGAYIDGEDYADYSEDTLTAQIILTTTDFVSFKKYNFNAWNDSNIKSGLGSYSNSFFGFIGDTLILADLSYKITKKTATATYGVGVYYTTKDFKNWTVNYTPEHDLGEITQGIYSYSGMTFSYKAASGGNALIIEYAYDEWTLENSSWDCKKSYLTTDFKNYTAVYNKKSNKSVYESLYCVDDKLNYCYRLDFIDIVNGEYDSKEEWVKFDLKTGKETVLLKTDDIYHWRFTYNSDSNDAYYIVENFDDTVQAYCLNINNGSLKTVPVDYKLSDCELYSESGNYLFSYENGKLCVSTLQNPLECNEYDISYINISVYDEYSSIYLFVLNGKVYILETTDYPDYGYYTRVAETDISLQKKGDLNGDNKINSTDALLVLKASVGEISLTKDQKSVADVNKDGKINSADALMILQFATGLLQSL